VKKFISNNLFASRNIGEIPKISTNFTLDFSMDCNNNNNDDDNDGRLRALHLLDFAVHRADDKDRGRAVHNRAILASRCQSCNNNNNNDNNDNDGYCSTIGGECNERSSPTCRCRNDWHLERCELGTRFTGNRALSHEVDTEVDAQRDSIDSFAGQVFALLCLLFVV
jgi:hypothetical protein